MCKTGRRKVNWLKITCGKLQCVAPLCHGGAAVASHRPVGSGGWVFLCTYCRLKEAFLSHIFKIEVEWLACCAATRPMTAPLPMPRKQDNKHTCAEENTPLDTDVKWMFSLARPHAQQVLQMFTTLPPDMRLKTNNTKQKSCGQNNSSPDTSSLHRWLICRSSVPPKRRTVEEQRNS